MFSSAQSYEGVLEQQRDPLNNAVLKVAGLDALDAMDKIQSHDEETQNSGSGSGFSDLSLLENETDDFGRLLLQHQRDAQRLNNAVRGGREHAFRKARPKPRVADRLEREERERQAIGQDHERRGSGGSDESDPPVTVPTEWGRRARKQTDWLRKIVAPSEDGEDAVVEDAIYPHKTAYTGDLHWRTMTDKPVQSVENTPPSMRRRQFADTPSSLNHMNTTLKPGAEFEEQDFTATSFLASTPAPTRYHRKVDELARQEIEELENHAITTRTLDQIDQRSPNATLRRTSSSRLRERAVADRNRSPFVSPEHSSNPSRIPVRRLNSGSNDKENVPLNGHVNGDVKAAAAAEYVNERAQPVNLNKIHKRPLHGRNDSMNLLKKLARVSSMSPSPGREKAMLISMEHERGSKLDGEAAANVGVDGDGEERSAERYVDAQSQHEGQDPEPKTAAKDEERPEFVRWKPEQGAFVETPKAELAQDSKSPVVAGAWVDSIHDGDADSLPITKELADEVQIDTIVEGLARIKPGYPKSALGAIVREMKAEREAAGAQQFGESTIQSLEDILHPDLDPTDPTITFELDAGNLAKEEILDGGRELTQAEKDRRQEDLAMEAMNKHLRTARTSIKDANRGLRRVENKIETSAEAKPLPAPSALATTKPGKTVIISPAANLSGTYCPTCGSPHTSVWRALYIELRSCFYTYSPQPHPHPLNKYLGLRICPTTLGLFCLWFWMWYISESILCAYWCHPLYTSYRYTVDPYAPRFPFVIPTLLLRPFKWAWQPLMEALEVWFHAYFGEKEEVMSFRLKGADGLHTKVGFEEWIAAATATGARVAKSVVDAVDEVGSMWDDEFLK